MTLWVEIKTVLVILVMFLLPGWAMLSVGQYWKRWQPLQRWFLALCLGVAVYPVIFYLVRAVLPDLRIGTGKLTLFLCLCGAVVIWNLSQSWREHLKFEKLSWLAVIILCVTLAVRFVIAHEHPFLAGDDSLHHTLLTELTARYGSLPHTLQPYDNTVLDHYHLGLYALTAPLKLLSGLRSDEALLWMCQFLNGIAGIGTFLLLDKIVSRKSAVVGLAFVGLLCVFPNYYVNWGRFTQLAAQVLLFPAALMYWEHLSQLKERSANQEIAQFDWTGIVFSGLTAGAVCLLHFRVAVFLAPFMGMIFIARVKEFRQNRPASSRAVFQTTLIVLMVLLIIAPALVPGLRAYLDVRIPQSLSNGVGATTKLSDSAYYAIGDHTTNRLSKGSGWLYLICSIGLVMGLFKPELRPLGLLMICWLLVFLVLAFAYLTNIALLTLMNRTAVLLVLYLPMSIGLGMLTHVVEMRFSGMTRNYSVVLWVIALLFSLWSTKARLNDYWPEQEYMTDADLKAMEWIRQNTPTDAVFGANTSFLSANSPFGTDAGYWIPYYANRETTTLTLISSLTDKKDSWDVQRARQIVNVYQSADAMDGLCDFDVTYLYQGAKPAVVSPSFNMADLLSTPGTSLIYNQDGVQILRICEGQ